MFNLPTDPVSPVVPQFSEATQKTYRKRHPYRVPHGYHEDKFHFHAKKIEKPVELWEAFPSMNFVDIRHTNEIAALKIALSGIKRSKRTLHVKEHNLKPYGIDRTIQVLGNTYVPIRRSEHRDIQAALMKMNPEKGIKNKHSITFIVVEDALYDSLVQALIQQNEKNDREEEAEPAIVKNAKAAKASNIIKPSKEKIATKAGAKIKQTIKKLKVLSVETPLSVDKSKEKKERELLKEEKYIRYGINQFERLQRMVLTEVNNKKDLEKMFNKWEDSCPPFPIRSTHYSSLWKEDKTQMKNLLIKLT